ncbi:MAG TPA: LarC family nickel insertion protein [Casimicrobiaceae bacterium]|nr:LarC family nickel insertion protein [Casimicrobiaceae bacterium]
MSSPSSADVPPHALAIHLDLVGGIAGDMFVAALLDALPWLEAPLMAEVEKVRPPGEGAATLSGATQAGLRAVRFGLGARPAPKRSIVSTTPAPSDYPSLRDRIAGAPLADDVRREALALLASIAEAEADVHGVALDAVHFHELADWNSLLDVVAAGFIAARLAGAAWTSSPPPLGGGTVKTAHGVLPVPAPVTARLLVGFPWRDDGVGGERVTPTGAAILRRLVAPATFDQPRAAGRLLAVGMGAGTMTLPGRPNVTRALVFDRTRSDAAATVATIAFDVDDMTGEEIGLAADRLRAAEGVLDVSVGARIGKKGRPLSDFRVLAEPARIDAVAQACFVETSTLGVRIAEARRRILRREEVRTSALGVKIAERPDGSLTAKAEHDDVRDGRSLEQRRRMRAEAERRALEGGT